MIYLGKFKAGDSVFYAANFHNDTGTIEDPTAPEAQLRNAAGTWSALTAPAKQNAKTGHFGGTIDTTGFSAGQYIIRMQGTVATAKTVATEFSFIIVANLESDIYARLGAPSGASVSADIAAVHTHLDAGVIFLTSTVTPGVLDSMLTVTGGRQVVYRGDVKTLTLTLGTAYNLTGKTAYLCVKKKLTDPNSSAIINRAITVTDAANGVGTITTTAAETATVGVYYAEVEVRDVTTEANPITAMRFELEIAEDVRK